MNGYDVLVACEFTGAVRDAFINEGISAISCDLISSEKPGPHYVGDVRKILYYDWKAIIAFPPCTYLANSGVRWLSEGGEIKALHRYYDMVDACLFFNLFDSHSCQYTCIENPVHHGYARKFIRKYDQIIQPHQFGHEIQKRTCLWLKGLPPLKPTEIVGIGKRYVSPKGKSGGAFCYMATGKNQKKDRSRTFPGIARAMAQQWKEYLI